jgi:hypothetical protein
MRGASLIAVLLASGFIMAGCIGTDRDPQAPVVEEEGPITKWVIDGKGNMLDATAFAGEVPSFDLVKASDRISGEPTVGVTRTGAIFYVAIDFDGPGGLPRSEFMRSVDGGETWENKSPHIMGVETHVDSNDPYVYVDPTTGRVYALDMAPSLTCSRISWSDDDGETWMTRELSCIPGVNDHPSLFAGPAAPWTNTAIYPNQLYHCTNQVTDTICYQSPDGGLNWYAGTPSHVGYDVGSFDPSNPLAGLCGGLAGHGHASWADGTVYLGRGWCGRVTAGVSHDYGLTWDMVVISDDPLHAPSEHDVSIATDTSGTAYALWIGDRGRSVFTSTSKDKGMTWSTPLNVTAPGVTAAKFPSIVAGADGRIAFLYVGSDNPHGHQIGAMDDGELRYPDAYEVATWNAYMGTSLNADSDDAVFAVVMANHPDEPLKRGACQGRCFGDEGGMYDFLDIDIDPMTGQVFAALVDVCSGDCDGHGKKKSEVHEKAVGTVARMLTGTLLLDEPFPERTALLGVPAALPRGFAAAGVDA